MLKESDFRDWYNDYRARWPAVGEYVAKRDNRAHLLDTWHQTLSAFDSATLERVTLAIIQGQMEPVPNVALGTFAEEIRKRCRQLLDWDRREQERTEQAQQGQRQRRDFAPLDRGNMSLMVRCAIAADQLLSERTGEPVDTSITYDPMFCGTPSDAAIVLADDHTQAEEEAAHAALEQHGLTWEQVLERAERMGKVSLVQSVEDAA